MSRIIKNDHPWDEDEIAYMRDRGREKEIAKNATDFPPGSEPLEDDDDEGVEVNVHPDIFHKVNSMDTTELQSELKKANLSARGEDVELKVRLANHLQEELEKSGNSGSN